MADGDDLLVERVADLERRLATLEAQRSSEVTDSPAPQPGADTGLDPEQFWALTGLQQRIGGRNAVLFTGSVRFPGGQAYVWQQGIDVDELLGADWDQPADALGALGHPIRLRLIQAVLNGASTTAELSATVGLGTTGQLYHHLRQLVAAGWLSATGRGRYELPAGRVVPVLVTIAAANR